MADNNGDYVDPVFEADAPKYFDFNRINDENISDDADLWFEKHFDENEDETQEIENAHHLQSHLENIGVVFASENQENDQQRNASSMTAQKMKTVERKIEVTTVSTTVTTVETDRDFSRRGRQPMRVLEANSQQQVVVIPKPASQTREVKNKSTGSRKSPISRKPVGDPVVHNSAQSCFQRNNRCASVDRAVSNEKLTVPLTPKLHTSTRVRAASRDNLHLNDQHGDYIPFKAQPVPRQLLASPTIGLKKPKAKTPTKAVEPNFATDKRLAHRRSFRDSKSQANVEKEKDKRKTFLKKVESLKLTAVEPFSFQQKEEQLIEKRKRLVEEFQKRESEKELGHQFKAAPMPSLSPDKLPEKYHKSPTIANPFSFLTDNIHLVYEKKLREKLELEEKARKQASEFRAHPADVLTKEPFKPKHEDHLPLEVEEFSLETVRRAEDRKRFEDFVKTKESEREAALAERRMVEERAAADEVKQIRSNAVHKAQPIKKYKDVEIKAKFDCTVPNPPRFLIDERLKSRRDK